MNSNHYLNSNLLYYKTCVINETIIINQIIGYNNITIKYSRISISFMIINQPLVQLLLFYNTQKNLHNLISCIETRTNLVKQEITSHLN